MTQHSCLSVWLEGGGVLVVVVGGWGGRGAAAANCQRKEVKTSDRVSEHGGVEIRGCGVSYICAQMQLRNVGRVWCLQLSLVFIRKRLLCKIANTPTPQPRAHTCTPSSNIYRPLTPILRGS